MYNNIAVVGAGISGLTAAYWLRKYGFSVTVYEAENRVGGRMTTDKINGCLIDRGAQFLSSDYATLMPLLRDVNMTFELVDTAQWAGIVRHGKIRKISARHLLSPVTSRYLSLIEALKFSLKLRQWRSEIARLPLDDYAAWVQFDNEDSASFIRREFGDRILEYLIEPQMQGFHYQSPEETSSIHALMLLSFIQKKGRVMTLRNGLGTLPEKIAKHLDIKLNCYINEIAVESNGGVILTSNAGKFSADKVILATPATMSKTILNAPDEIERTLLDTKYGTTINIGLATTKNWILPKKLRHVYGILIPRQERQRIAGIGIESNKSTGRVQEGELFDIMLDSQSGAELLNSSDEIIMKSIMPEMEKYFPGISQFVRLSHIIRWKDAEPISFLGKSKMIRAYRENLTASKRIILAGDYMGFPYTDSAAFTGKWAAGYINRTGC